MTIQTARRRRRSRSGAGGASAASLEAELLTDFSDGLVWALGSDPADHFAQDLTVNNKDGTIAGAPTFTPDLLLSGISAMVFDGSNDNITRVDEVMFDSQRFTFSFLCRFDNFASQRELFGKVDKNQVWIETTGKLTCYYTPAWSSFPSVRTFLVNTPYLITVRHNATHLSLFVNGVLDAEVAKGDTFTNSAGALVCGYSSTGPRRFLGKGNYFCYKPEAVSDARLLVHAQAAGLA
jgi:hypothetical protein